MADDKPSKGARIAAIVLSVLCALLWIIIAPNLAGLSNSDPAGNAMAQGFAGLGLILLWILLLILTLIAVAKGTMPPWARSVVLLVPTSGAAALAALELLSRPGNPPWHWPMLIPVFVPPLIVAYSLLALLRSITTQAAILMLGAIALLSAAVVPLHGIRTAHVAQMETTGANQRAALAALPADAPLWEFTPFLATRDQTIGTAAIARIQKLERRQADAEAMFARGDFPLDQLSWFNLDMTPALCANARAMLRRRAEQVMPTTPGMKPYSDVSRDVRAALSAMLWLVGYGCALDAESLAWENAAKAYRDPGYDVTMLKGLRDRADLGRRLREDPALFSQLNAQSHLKGWIKFTDQAETREKVIAGVRTLPNRTAEAIEILTDKNQENSRFRLLRILPQIDLEATPALCAAAAGEVGRSVRDVFRPRADDPYPYSGLIDRLGVGRPLTVLIWLGEHGCDVAAEARDAEAVVRAYHDTPGRAEMLAALMRLQGAR